MKKVDHKVRDGVELKCCGFCKKYLPLENFSSSKNTADSLYNHCIKCCAIKRKERRLKNLEHTRKKDSEYTKRRRETKGDHVREIERGCRKRWSPERREEVNRQRREFRRENITFRLSNNFGTSIGHSLRGDKNGLHWELLVPYTIDELKQHLESQFREGMSWDNYGLGFGKWNIDHKKPVSSFNFLSYKDIDFRKCWSLENLQPLWSVENSSKNSFYDGIKCSYEL